ncbi:MAG: MarR family transcriptional regulator [Thermotogota bacterium]|nr:MarR family transcriptional regulator [Thermotogota bacterium]
MPIDNKILEIMMTVKKIMMLIKQHLDQEFKALGISESQGLIIRTLMEYGDMKVSDIAKRLDLSNSTVSGIVDRLVEKGVIDRKRSEEDRRVVIISLAKSHRQPLKRHFEAVCSRLNKVMDLGSEQELDDIAKSLEKLKGLLEKAQTVED